MIRRRSAVVALAAVVLLTAVAPALLASGAVASTSTAPTSAPLLQQENATESPESSEDGSGQGDENTVVAEVDSQIRVTSYSYDDANETMSITFENRGDSRSLITITEAISADQSGAGSFGIERVRIGGGSTVTAKIDVSRNPESGAAGVMITTTDSVENGKGVYLQDVEEPEGASLIEGSSSWGFVWFGAIVALLVVGLIILLSAWQYVATVQDDYDEVDVVGDNA